MKTCSIADCGQRHFGRGWCQKHYSRWRRWGDPLYVKPRGPQADERDGLRRCRTCSAWKPFDDFHSGTKGRRRTCKVCVNAASREQWSDRSSPMRIARRRYDLLSKFGISPEQYEAMVIAQGGGCALCGKTKEAEGRLFPVDHDHDSGAVRGVLCTDCNRRLGVVEAQGVEWVSRALAYLDEHSDWRLHVVA